MSSDNRQSRRLPPQSGNDFAAVRIGRGEWIARIANESAGGMELVLDGFPEIGVGERIIVKIHSGWYELSVVRMEITDETTRLGLKRISTLPELASLAADARRNRNSFVANLREVSPITAVAIGFILCVACGMAGPEIVNGSFYSVFGHEATNCTPVSIEDLEFDATNSNASTLLYSLSSLNSPEIIESLSLCPSQQLELRNIYRETSRTLAKLYDQASSMPPHVLQRESAKTVERSMLRVLRLLDDRQVQQWIRSLSDLPQARTSQQPVAHISPAR